MSFHEQTRMDLEVTEEGTPEKTELEVLIESWKGQAALFCDKPAEIKDYIKMQLIEYQKSKNNIETELRRMEQEKEMKAKELEIKITQEKEIQMKQ